VEGSGGVTDQTVLELLRKIRELAKRGVDGERDNAARLLEAKLQKYGLSLEDLERVKTKRWYWKYGTLLEAKIISHVVARVADYQGSCWKRVGKKVVGYDLTYAQGIEAAEWIEHYLAAWKREVKEHEELLFRAFINKHDLFAATVPEGAEVGSAYDKDPEMLGRVFSVMGSLRNVEAPVKKIEAGGQG
jgi:hypothetical protein